MAQVEEGESFQPIFPALEACLLVDPRHSARQDLRRDIKASNLFENIVEAKSLDDATRIIGAHRFDAVFLGTSLNGEKATTLLASLIPKAFSKDCAFLVVIPQMTLPHEPYFTAGAHRLIEVPCPRSAFMENVVRGVMTANASSPWTGIVVNAEANGKNLFGEDRVLKATSAPLDAIPPRQPIVPAGAGELNRATLQSVIAQSAPGLKQLRKQIENGECVIDSSGNLDERSREMISALLDSILKDSDLQEKVPSFRAYFEAGIVGWVSDVKTYGPADATDELRKKLLAFKP